MDSDSIMLLIAGIAFGIFLIAMNVTAIRIFRRGNKLDRHSDQVTGKVSEKREVWSKTVNTWHIYYEFLPPGHNQDFKGDSRVEKELFTKAQKGNSIEIIYFPADPSISEIKGAIRKNNVITFALILDVITLLLIILVAIALAIQ